jgi:phage tail sheath protein FI
MTHGITLTESTTGTRTISTKSSAIIGLIGTSTAIAPENQAAIDAAFPLDTPVLFTSAAVAAGKAGSGGTLKAALTAIDDIVTPTIIILRVAVGEDEEDQDAAVIGTTDGSAYTGMQALLKAEAVTGYRPRIIGAPGLDTQAVTTKLAILAKKLRGFAYARAIGDTNAEARTYREEFGSRELMLIWPNSSATVTGDAVARALGLRAYLDEAVGWHKTISNITVAGITAVTQDVHYDLLDNDTDAGLLNDADITTIIRTTAGYRFWGNRTCAGDDQTQFAFESATRTLYALQDVIAATFSPFFDQPMTVGLIKDLLETVNAQFRKYVLKGWVMGAQAFFDADSNTPAELAAGRPNFRIQFTPCAPMENPQVSLVITDIYYTGFAESVTG